MKINNLELLNFRNINSQQIKFNKRIIYIVGENGQGKTNLIEAISILSLLKSFRTNNYKNLITYEKDYFVLKSDFSKDDQTNLKIMMSYQNGHKNIKLNNKKIEKFSDLWGKIPLVYLISDETIITSGPPKERRNFLDQLISIVSRDYFNALKQYKILIQQKNKVLLELKKRELFAKDLLNVYNQQIIALSEIIVSKRIKFLKEYQHFFKEILSYISANLYQGEIIYQSLIKTNDYSTNLALKLKEKMDDEINRGNSLVGPHKDELIFKINDKDIRFFGSKGQQKIFLISLKLAEIEFIKLFTDEYPIFLIDDLYGEIDFEKSTKIAQILDKDIQTIITTCDKDKIKLFNRENLEIIEIAQGKVIEEKRI